MVGGGVGAGGLRGQLTKQVVSEAMKLMMLLFYQEVGFFPNGILILTFVLLAWPPFTSRRYMICRLQRSAFIF